MIEGDDDLDEEALQRRSYAPPPPPPPPNLLSRVLWTMTWTLAIVLGLFAVFRVIWHDGLWPFVLANAFTPYLFIPAYVLLVLGALSRRWGLNFLALALVGYHVAAVGPQVLPRSPPPERGPAELTLVTANLSSGNSEVDAMLREIEVHTPDLILLQEVDEDWQRSLREGGWFDVYPHGITIGEGNLAAAILTREPVEQTGEVKLAGLPLPSVTLRLGDEPIDVLNVHLPPPTLYSDAGHRRAGADLLTWQQSRQRPFIVAGTLNSTPYSWLSVQLERRADDAWALLGLGLGGTWPNGTRLLPPARIDRVLISEDLTPLEMILGDGPGSDHRVLMARIAHRAVAEP